MYFVLFLMNLSRKQTNKKPRKKRSKQKDEKITLGKMRSTMRLFRKEKNNPKKQQKFFKQDHPKKGKNYYTPLP
ncbi:hypothetical protein RFI_16331 [Reticulomyxa filosa]|uniref:Uncharacterized protein n=1 Tax=Reticulomyxa filosa TaxID=46433 RepID=X6N580_RETFI|nr:hypothetical protein RFI_16331 [Reticulomyxa filosa]|eukprot:ETO20879.1 hypothetical protein RFI_16331 [Reticulomyxa filosa]